MPTPYIFISDEQPLLPISGEQLYNDLMEPINPSLTTTAFGTPDDGKTPLTTEQIGTDFAKYDQVYGTHINQLHGAVERYEHDLFQSMETRDARNDVDGMKNLENAINSL